MNTQFESTVGFWACLILSGVWSASSSPKAEVLGVVWLAWAVIIRLMEYFVQRGKR